MIFAGIAWIARSEVPAGFHRLMPGTQLDVDVGIGFQKCGREAHDGGRGRRDFQVIEENRRDPFIDQNAAMLRIIAKFDHVEVAVVAFEQMRLRAAAHLPDQACGFNQHP